MLANKNNFPELLKVKMDSYAHLIYKATRNFPKEEVYGITSQLRRSGLSVVLNYIEGFARYKRAVKLNFWEISYGSLKESKYLIHFALVEKYIGEEDYRKMEDLSEEIGVMLWKLMQSLK